MGMGTQSVGGRKKRIDQTVRGPARWGVMLGLVGTLAVAGSAGCHDINSPGPRGTTRLSPRPTPYLTGIPVPSGFQLIDENTEDYESGGQRTARHWYEGSADIYAVRNFYREQMPLVGWNRVSDQNIKGTITIRFENKKEACTATITEAGTFGRCRIQIVVMPFSRTPSEPPTRRPVP